MLTYFLWFAAGALSYRIVSLLLMVRLERAIVVSALRWVAKVITATDSDLKKAIRIKQENLRATSIPNEVLDKIEESDNKFISQWKETIFTTVAISIPQKYLKHVPHFVWEPVSLKQKAKELEKEDSK